MQDVLVDEEPGGKQQAVTWEKEANQQAGLGKNDASHPKDANG